MPDSPASVAVEPPPSEPSFLPPTTTAPTASAPTEAAHPSRPPPLSPPPVAPPNPDSSDPAVPRKQPSATSARRTPPPAPAAAPSKPVPRRPARPPARRAPAPALMPKPATAAMPAAPRRDAATGKYHRGPPPSTTATSLGRLDASQSVNGKSEPALLVDSGDATSVLGSSREPAPGVLPAPTGSLDEYREGCLKLEKIRHAKVFEAEKRRLFYENSIESEYQRTVQMVLDDYLKQRNLLVVKLLCENSDKVRHVQELRHRIIKDEGTAGGWQRKHEMALRGRGSSAENNGENGSAKPGGRSALEEDGVLAELERENGNKEKEKRGRSRKNDSRQKVKVHIEVEESEALSDLALIRGEKRPREPEPSVERRTKKRK